VITVTLSETKELSSNQAEESCSLDQNSASCSDRCNLIRSKLKYNLDAHLTCGEPFERVTFDEMLQIPKLANYSFPFVMTGAIQGYEPLRDLDWLTERFKWEIADFYPVNELNIEYHPIYLYRFKAGMEQLQKLPGEGVFGTLEIKNPEAKFHPAKYLQLTVLQQNWVKLPINFHDWFVNDFFTSCLTKAQMDEFFIRTHWKMMLIGQRGAGMFYHKDAIRSSAWHLHVAGRKWWRVCYEDKCFEEILGEGDVLFYPRDWFHKTQCVDMYTTTLASQLLTEHNKIGVVDELWQECASDKHRFKYSGSLCDALDICWEEIGLPVKPWRQSATWNRIQEMDLPDASKTWYDLYVVHGEIPPEEHEP